MPTLSEKITQKPSWEQMSFAYNMLTLEVEASVTISAPKTNKAEAKFEGWFNKPILSTTQRRMNIAI